MAQPSLSQSFDTSLVDLSPSQAQGSFSTTESAPSDDYKQAQADLTTPTAIAASVPAPLPVLTPKFEEASTSTRKMPTRYVPTVEAYDSWAEVYDSDGNVLQAVDDYELGDAGGRMMREFLTEVSNTHANPNLPLNIVDLGCGTGRNTVALLIHDSIADLAINITGIDASIGMLSKAEQKLEAAKEALDPTVAAKRTFTLLRHDFLDPADATRPPVPFDAESFVAVSSDLTTPTPPPYDGLITTLVLEHFPLPTFFLVLSSILQNKGVALLTNMHYNMGMQSQAGFVSQDEHGEAIKVRGTSWVHGTKETVDAAMKAGFEVLGLQGVRERAVTEEMIESGIVGERGRKWVGINVWYGMILRKIS